MAPQQDYADPNRGFPNPKVDPDLVDHDAEVAKQAEDSAKAARKGRRGVEPKPGTGAGTSVPVEPAEGHPAA